MDNSTTVLAIIILTKKLYDPVEVIVVRKRVPSRSDIARSAKQR